MTGHTGFKGSWLSIWLNSLGAEVTGYALPPPTNPSLFDLARVNDLLTSNLGDIRDLDLVREEIKLVKPEIVIHMAAQPIVRDSYRLPVETYAVNVMGTVNLLEAVRHCPGVRAVVNGTTDKCYENREWVWGYRENEPMGGYGPYSNSKACSELVTASYRDFFFNPLDFHQHGVALASARSGNVIGGGDWAVLLADMIKAGTAENVTDALRSYGFDRERAVDFGNAAAGRNLGEIRLNVNADGVFQPRIYTARETGLADISLESNGKALPILARPTPNALQWGSLFLTKGEHKVRLVAATAGRAIFDSFQLAPVARVSGALEAEELTVVKATGGAVAPRPSDPLDEASAGRVLKFHAEKEGQGIVLDLGKRPALPYVLGVRPPYLSAGRRFVRGLCYCFLNFQAFPFCP